MLPKELLGWVDEQLDSIGRDPGLALAVVDLDADEQTEFHCWGLAQENGNKVDVETIFSLASCSKAFNATAIGLCIDDDCFALPGATTPFSWDTKVKDVLPQFRMHDEAKISQEDLKIRDLCCHRSGIPGYIEALSVDDRPEDVVQKMRFCRPTASIREKPQYDNMGIITSAHMLHIITSHPISHHVTTRIFRPLGMTSSTYSPEEAAKTGKLCDAFETIGGKLRRMPFWLDVEGGKMEVMNETQAAPGGVLSTIKDMSRWIHCLLLKGKSPDDPEKTIISAAAYNETTRGHQADQGRTTNGKAQTEYGLGWMISNIDGHDLVEHAGGQQGVMTLVSFLPNDRLGIVILCNFGYLGSVAVTQGLRRRIVLNKIRRGSWQEESGDQREMSGSAQPTELSEVSDCNAGEFGGVASLAGLYESPLFGQLRLHTSKENSKALEDFKSVVTLDETYLYATLDKFWYTHLWLKPKHSRSADFWVQCLKIYSQGCGKDTSPILDDRTPAKVGSARFVLHPDGQVKGMAWNDVVGTKGVKLPGSSIEERAEVWFERVTT